MKRPLLILAGLAACALLVGGLWFASQSNTTSAADDVVLLAPGGTNQPGSTEVGELDAPVLEPRTTISDGSARDSVEVDEQAKPEIDPRRAVPKDVIWIEGLVVEPDGLPPGDQLYVSAKGKSFDRKTKRRSHEVKVKPDGTFRVALAKGTRIGWLNVRSRFAYLEESYKVKPRRLDEEIVLEPVLGGVLRGEVIPPLNLAWADDPLRGGRAELMMWGEGRNTTQYEDLNGGTGFEFLALPPGEFDGNFLSVRSDFLQRGTPSEKVEIKPGEVTDVAIELKAGARLYGKLVDDNGKVVPDGKIELRVSVDGDDWGGWMDRQKLTADDIDAEGKFAFFGVRPGKITLTGSATGYRDAELEVGEVADGEQRTGLELVVDKGRSISGMVRWPDGRAAVGALVKLEQEADNDSWAMWEAIPSVKTDESGRFEISGLTVDGSCRVVASLRPAGEKRPESADDKQGKARRKPRPHAWRARKDGVQPGNSDLILTLDSGASVTGRVVDDRGEAVTRFHVTATPMDREMSRIDWETRTGTTVLAGDGSFKLEGIQEGKWNLFAASDGHVRSEEQPFQIPHDGRELVVVCPRAAEIQGVVRDPAGELITGATVQAKRITRGTDGHISDTDWAGNDKTNSKGGFKLEDLRYGTIELVASADGFATSDPLELQLAAGQQLEEVALRLRVGARLRIELHPALVDVEDREVTVNQINGDYWETHETDAGGVVIVEGLSGGEYSVSLKASEEWAGESWELRNANEITEKVELRAGGSGRVILGTPPENPVRITGRVTRGGAAVAGAVVTCQANSGGGNRRHGAKANAAGEYQLTVDEAGTYNFTVRVGNDDGAVDFGREVPAQESVSFDFELPTMSVSGLITTPGGEAASGVSVTLQRVHTENDPNGTVYRTLYEQTDSDGHYEFKTLQAGTYHLRAAAEQGWGRRRSSARYAQQVLSNLVVQEGESRVGVDLQLETPGRISGVVYGSDGAPVSGAWVQATDANGVPFEGGGQDSTGESGRFRLTGLPPGDVKLRAMDGQRVSEELDVEVFSDQESEVELRLSGS